MAKRMSREEERQLVTRNSALVALKQHPSWPDLEAKAAEKRGRIEASLLHAVFHSEEPLDQHKVAYWRGFVAGLEWFMASPERAEGTLERFLKRTERSGS